MHDTLVNFPRKRYKLKQKIESALAIRYSYCVEPLHRQSYLTFSAATQILKVIAQYLMMDLENSLIFKYSSSDLFSFLKQIIVDIGGTMVFKKYLIMSKYKVHTKSFLIVDLNPLISPNSCYTFIIKKDTCSQ